MIVYDDFKDIHGVPLKVEVKITTYATDWIDCSIKYHTTRFFGQWATTYQVREHTLALNGNALTWECEDIRGWVENCIAAYHKEQEIFDKENRVKKLIENQCT